VHRTLGVDAAAARARAAAAQHRRVATHRSVGRADRLGSGVTQPGVAPRAGELDGGDAQGRFDRVEVSVQIGRPGDAELVAPAPQDLARRAQAGARVDDRRAADTATDRHRDGGAALADRQARVAVEQRQRVDRVGGIGRCVVVVALLDDDDVETGLGEHTGDRRPTGAGADDDDIAALDVGRGHHLRRLQRRRTVRVERLARMSGFTAAAGAERRQHGGVARVTNGGDRLAQQGQVAQEAQARMLQPADVRDPPLEREPREAMGKRRPLEHP